MLWPALPRAGPRNAIHCRLVHSQVKLAILTAVGYLTDGLKGRLYRAIFPSGATLRIG